MTDEVPWGYVCGYPTERGDLYGGAHYSQSSSADLTPQGRAIRDASIRFGDGTTLPFTPCKKGYAPIVEGKRFYACPLHDKERRKRVRKEKGVFRMGEVDLNLFWQREENLAKEMPKDPVIESPRSTNFPMMKPE